MTFRYLKYLTAYGNTIVAESATAFTLGPGEGQIYTNYDIPAVQPLYLYAESGGNVVVNSDYQINLYLESIGEEPFENTFTGYTASTESRFAGIEADVNYVSGQTALKLNTSAFNVYSGATQTQINNKLSTSAFNIYSGATQTQINNKLNSSLFNTYTGTTAPATYLGKTEFNGYSATTLTNINSRLLKTDFNVYSGATQTTINGKLNISTFNTYSADTYQLIQASQAGLDPKESVLVATTAPLGGGATYIASGGTAGTGRFTSAPTSIDGITLSNGKRVLVKNQVDKKQNGIYVVISSGVWNRSTDMDGSPATEVSAGNYAFVETGSTQAGSGWSVIGTGQLTLNVDQIVWTQFNSATAYVAGTGILIGGQTISFDGASVAGNALTWSGTQLNVNPTGGTLGTKFNTKLDISAFNVYSAATQSTINGKLNTSIFNTYTGTTAPATYLSIANFNVYSGATLSLINGKLSTSAFNVYSASTLTNINSRVLKTVFNTYTGTTAPATYLAISAFNAYSASTLSLINGKLSTSAFNVYSAQTQTQINGKIGSANNGLTKSGTNVRLGGNLTGATTIGLGTSSITFTGTTGTLKYGSDLSASYTTRSLIDQGYYTGHTLYTKSQLIIYSSGSTNLNVTTAVAIPFNVAAVSNDTSVFTSTGGTVIKVLSAGTYDVSYGVNLTNSTATNKSIAVNLYKNGTIVDGTLTSGTFSTTSAGMSLTLPPTQLTLAANDLITVKGYRLISASGNATIVPNSTFLSIVKKN